MEKNAQTVVVADDANVFSLTEFLIACHEIWKLIVLSVIFSWRSVCFT